MRGIRWLVDGKSNARKPLIAKRRKYISQPTRGIEGTERERSSESRRRRVAARDKSPSRPRLTTQRDFIAGQAGIDDGFMRENKGASDEHRDAGFAPERNR